MAEIENTQELRAGGNGLVSVKTAQGVLDAMKRNKGIGDTPAVQKSDLASYVMATFNENQDYKRSENIEEKLLDNLRRRIGEYSPAKLAAIRKQGGSAIFAEITGVKCRNAEAWLADVFSPDDEKAWSLKATPVPELPSEAMKQVDEVAQAFATQKVMEAQQGGQQVQPQQLTEITDKSKALIESFVKDKVQSETDKRVRNMENLMYDQLLECQWDKALDAFLFDLCTMKAAIMKGPVIQMRKTRRWKINSDGTSDLIVERKPMPVFKRVSPFDFYPSPLSESAEGPGPMVEKLWLTRSSLEDMKSMEGYSSARIDSVLSNFPVAAPQNPDTSNDTERLELENKGRTEDAPVAGDTIFGLEFHGFVQGKLLLDYGLKEDNDGKQLRLNKEYSVEVIQVGDNVLYASLNPDKLDRHPYSSTSWAKLAGAFWGEGVPELLTSVQDVCNASLRALVNNMGFASGPQCAINDIDRIPDGEDLTEIYPFKMHQFTNERNMTADPIKFFIIPSNANELYSVYENFNKQADDVSGIPAYAYGNERTAGAGRTASGLSMLMTGASRGIKKVIRNVHRDVIRPSLIRLYDWNMVFVDDPNIKGDADVVAMGAVAILSREQTASRRMELLTMTNNDTDLKIFGMKNRARLWRETLDTLEFDGSDRVLTDEELDEVVKKEEQALAQMQQAQAQASQAEAQSAQVDQQAKLKELEIKQQEVANDYEVDLLKIEQKGSEIDIKSVQEAASAEIKAVGATDKKESK